MFGWEYHGGGWWLIPIAFMVVMCIGMMWRGKMGCMPMMHDGQGDRHGETDTPIEIVKRRYAAGEIDREEYGRVVKELTE